MIYSLALSLIFSLLLQFYLQNLISNKKQVLLQKERLQAQLMVKLTQKEMRGITGIVYFDKGICKYQIKEDGVHFEVEFTSGNHISLTG